MRTLTHGACLLAAWSLAFLAACSEPARDLEPSEDLVEMLPFAETSFPAPPTDRQDLVARKSDELFVPYGGRIDFYLRLRPEALLRIEKLTFSDGGEGVLEIRLATDDRGEKVVARESENGATLEYRLAELTPLAARLSLVARGQDTSEPTSGAILSSPAIWAPSPGVSLDHGGPDERSSSMSVPEAPDRMPNIVLYLVDTLRPDHLGAYGYGRATSPNLDAFAEKAHLFEYAVGQSPWTRPSVASIFTGMTPMAHGTVSKKTRLDDSLPVLAEILQHSGYATAAVFSNPNVSPTFGFDRGFDEVLKASANFNDAARKGIAWLESDAPREEPFFLYVHTSEPHQPYLASPEYRKRFAPDADEIVEIFERNPSRQIWPPKAEIIRQLRDLYDAEIAENDAGFGELLRVLERRGVFDDSLIIYVSDHGEEFFEHKRWGHGRSLYVDQLNVALVLKFPNQTRGSRVTEAVQHADILPTILDCLDLPIPSVIEGRSLAGLAAEDEPFEATTTAPLFSHNVGGSQFSVVVDDFKLMRRMRKGELRLKGLFNWRDDPRELDDLLPERPILTAVLNTLIERQRARHASVERADAELDESIREELRALGYLE